MCSPRRRGQLAGACRTPGCTSPMRAVGKATPRFGLGEVGAPRRRRPLRRLITGGGLATPPSGVQSTTSAPAPTRRRPSMRSATRPENRRGHRRKRVCTTASSSAGIGCRVCDRQPLARRDRRGTGTPGIDHDHFATALLDGVDLTHEDRGTRGARPCEAWGFGAHRESTGRCGARREPGMLHMAAVHQVAADVSWATGRRCPAS